MKTVLLAGLILAGSLSSFSQDAKQKNYFNKVDSVETSDYKAVISKSVSNMAYCKLGLKLSNLSNDYLMVRLHESTFTLNGTAYNGSKEKEVMIFPMRSKSITYTAGKDEAVNYLVENFDFKWSGVYKLPAENGTVAAPNFNLPAAENSISFGDFKINLLKLKSETKETVAIFEVLYSGDAYAIVDASKLSMIIPKKGVRIFANNFTKSKVRFLTKGETTKVKAIFNVPVKYADMTSADMQVVWNNTFQSATPVMLDGSSFKFELNKVLTDENN